MQSDDSQRERLTQLLEAVAVGSADVGASVDQLLQMRASAHVDERIDTMARLAAGLAHDLNNDLTGLMGCAQVLADGARSEDVPRLAQEVLKASRRAQDLAGVLTMYGRLRAGPAAPGPSDALATVRSCVRVLQRWVPKSVRIEADVQSGSLHAEPSPGELGRWLSGMILRISDRLDDVARLEITARRGPSTGASERLEITLGAPVALEGIADAYVEAVRGFSGELITQPLGKGALIQLQLPLRSVGAESDETEAVPSGASALVVDDEPGVQRVLMTVLRRAGFEVFVVGDGASAIELAEARSEPFDLLVSDLELPKVPGVEVIRRVGPGVRACVVMTGQGPTEEVQALLRDGRSVLLEKPFRPNEVLACVNAAFARGR